MMLEILGIAVVLTLVAVVWGKRTQAAAARQSNVVNAQQPQQPQMRYALQLPGTEPFEGTLAFVKNFGLKPADVQDLRYLKGEGQSLKDFPKIVRECLSHAYETGFGRGIMVATFLNGGQPLQEKDALFFALVKAPEQPVHVVAFIDKLR